jgi:hypothetical protein
MEKGPRWTSLFLKSARPTVTRRMIGMAYEICGKKGRILESLQEEEIVKRAYEDVKRSRAGRGPRGALWL